jgi:isoleucyl-tRNA synthetase
VILDTTVTQELAAEGLARDVVRAVQQARREAGLQVSDRIRLRLSGDESVQAGILAHLDLIQAETLAISLDLTDGAAPPMASVGDHQHVGIALERA